MYLHPCVTITTNIMNSERSYKSLHPIPLLICPRRYQYLCHRCDSGYQQIQIVNDQLDLTIATPQNKLICSVK